MGTVFMLMGENSRTVSRAAPKSWKRSIEPYPRESWRTRL